MGIVLITTDEETLNKVKQDPENAEKYISTEDTIQKQKIVIK